MPLPKLKYKGQNEKRESPLFGIFLLVSMLSVTALGIGVAYFSLAGEMAALYESLRSRGWTKTEGVITKNYNATTRVRAGSAKNPGSALVYVPTVEYTFEAGGETLTGNRINFSAEEKHYVDAAEGLNYLKSSYPVNKRVEVFYNPNNPRESALSREYVYDASSYQAGCGCGIPGLLFGFLSWLSLRDLIKYFRRRKRSEQ